MSTSTKDHILDTAERLFAEHGVGATSLRGIMTAAGVNPAAVHYHFGGKEALIEAVLSRRLDPLNAERFERLDAIEAVGGRPSVEAVVEAFLTPALRLRELPDEGGPRFMRIVGRFYNESTEEAADLFQRKFQPVIVRFSDSLARAMPDMDPVVLAWRLHFLVGSMAHTMSCPEHVEWFAPGAKVGDVDTAIRELVAFAVAGLTAPVPKKRSKKREAKA